MGRMYAAGNGVPPAENLGQDAGMRRGFDFIPVWLSWSDRSPSHRRHKQRTIADVLEKRFHSCISRKSLAAQHCESAMNDKQRIARDAGLMKNGTQNLGVSHSRSQPSMVEVRSRF